MISTPGPIPVNPSEPRVSMSRDDYLRLFLDASDFGGTMKLVQDTRLKGPGVDDHGFPKFQGILTGFACWMHQSYGYVRGEPQLATIWRAADIRTVFPTYWQASGWHSVMLPRNAEGQAELRGVPLIGEECRVFGGPKCLPLGTLTHYFYIFRVGRVCVKLYVRQGNDAAHWLTAEAVAGLATQVVRRIETRILPNSDVRRDP